MPVRSLLRRFLWVGLTSFGAARWTNLHAAFVESRLISEDKFVRDLAISQTLPGPGFVNLTALCGMRLGGVRLAAAGLALVLLPGLLAIVAAMTYLSTDEAWVARFFHGILVGAVGVLAASFVRLSAARVRARFDIFLTTAALVLVVARVPLFVVVVAIGALGAWRYRATPQSEP